MSASIYTPNIEWEPIRSADGPAIMRALDTTLQRWRSTPYESGQRFCGRAADCIGSVFGVVDDLDGRGRARHAGMPHDTAMHQRGTAIAAMRELVRRYSPCQRLRGEGKLHVQPGDIVVTGEPGGGPGHVEIVGARKNELWHAMPASGFHQGGWSLLSQQVLFAVYRINDKSRWAR